MVISIEKEITEMNLHIEQIIQNIYFIDEKCTVSCHTYMLHKWSQ